jgi:hypothetical protein
MRRWRAGADIPDARAGAKLIDSLVHDAWLWKMNDLRQF